MTGAERYFEERMTDPAYAAAYHSARGRICPSCGGEKDREFYDCDQCGKHRNWLGVAPPKGWDSATSGIVPEGSEK